MMKICVLGLGEVGLPTALYMVRKHEVWGYDIASSAVNRAKDNGLHVATKNWSEIPSMDVYVVCVSTRLSNDGTPDLSPVFDCCEKIACVADKPTLVSIESTIVPLTSRKIYQDIFEKRIALVHVPHRFYGAEPIEHGVKQKRAIGGIDEKSLKLGREFYEANGIPLHVVSSIEIAEMTKVAENAYRFVQISFAEELKMICTELSLSFEQVREACNTKWNIDILDAKDGIGGHCLPKDIRYLMSLTNGGTLLKSAITVDATYKNWKASKATP
jgi:nucleotide sugar dehydrogenase